jgi:membrane protease YdiL (CAAX protease family)
MPSGPTPQLDDRTGRICFHIALAGIFGICVAPVLSWVLALRQLPRRGRWRWWLLGLAVFDTIVAVCLGVVVARGTPNKAVGPTGPRMGVGLNQEDPTRVQVVSVTPGSPAEHSGLQPGDRVLSVDDQPIPNNDTLSRTIAATVDGTARRLRVERGGQVFAVDVTPVTGLPPPPAPRRGLFDPVNPSRGSDADELGLRDTLRYGLAETFIVALVVLAARRRGNRKWSVPVGVVAAFWLAEVMPLLTALALRRTLGLSLGVALIGSFAGSISILVVAVVLARRSNIIQQPAVRALGTLQAIALGILYYLAGGIRVMVVAAAFTPTLGTRDQNVFGLSTSWPPVGIALGLVLLVVIAPLGEELLFRGVLLPWMATWTTPSMAVLLSALVFAVCHLHYGTGVVLILVAGVVLGWARVRTGRLRASVALHALLNAATSAVFLLRD